MGSIVEDLAAKVATYTTIETSVVALLTDLSARLKSAQASGDPTQITTLIAQLDANNAVLAAAVTANTPAVVAPPAPAPVVAPATPVSTPGDTGTATAATASSPDTKS